MTMVLSPTLFLLAAAIAAPSAFIHSVDSIAIKPTPPSQPPKSLSSRSSSRRPTTTPGWRSGDARQQRKHQSSTLRAYTVGDISKPSWASFLNLPTPFDFGPVKDSLFSFEAGGAISLPTRPLMPNLEVEAATISAASGVKTENDDLLSELATMTKSFEELKVQKSLLEEGLSRMTATLERQDQKLREFQQAKEDEESTKDGMKVLEGENVMLRQRMRVLELDLSEVAYESRKLAPTPPIAAVDNLKKEETSAVEAISGPKPPSAPVPAHILQQSKLEQLQVQLKKYEEERASVRKLFSLGIRRSVNKVGRALNLWSPVHNLVLWGELRGN